MADEQLPQDDEALEHIILGLVSRQVRKDVQTQIAELERRMTQRLEEMQARPSETAGMSRKEVGDLILKAAKRIMDRVDSPEAQAKVRRQAEEAARAAARQAVAEAGGAPPAQDLEALVVDAVALALEDSSFLDGVKAAAREEARMATGQGAGGTTRDEVQSMVAEGVEAAAAAILDSDALTQRILELTPSGAASGVDTVQAAREAVREALLGDDFLAVLTETIEAHFTEFRSQIQGVVDDAIRASVDDLLNQPAFRQALGDAVAEQAEGILARTRTEVQDGLRESRRALAEDQVRELRAEIAEQVGGYIEGPDFGRRVEEVVQVVSENRGEADAAIQGLVEREVAARIEEYLNSDAVTRRVADRVTDLVMDRLPLQGDAGQLAAGRPAAHTVAARAPRPGPATAHPTAGSHPPASGLLARVKRLRRG